jgi:hypothetical protein
MWLQNALTTAQRVRSENREMWKRVEDKPRDREKETDKTDRRKKMNKGTTEMYCMHPTRKAKLK